MRKLFIFIICAIIYGSLFPFSFNFSVGLAERWGVFLHSFYPFTSLGDILGNIVLFIPFGFFAVESQSQSTKPAIRKILLYGFFLALIIQVIQVYLPSRSPSVADVYWNMLGIFLGIGSVRMIKARFPNLTISDASNIPVLLALLWLLSQLFPFVPTLDFQEVKNGLKPLLLAPSFHLDDFLIGVTGWLLFIYFTADFFRKVWPGRLALPLIVIGTIPARLIILSNDIDLSDSLAVFVALLIWPYLTKARINLEKTLSILITATIFIYSMGAFDMGWRGSNFSWIPFSGFLEGSLFYNTRALFFKFFLFGSMIWLIRTGWPYHRLRILWIFLYILLLEFMQIFMTSHSAEITDPLLILLLATIIRGGRKQTHDVIAKFPAEKKNKSRRSPLWSFLPLIISVLLITLTMSVIIKLPGIPYNVRELFRLDGLFIAIIPFAIFTLWFGMSVPLISSRLMRKPDHHYMRFPLLVLGAGLVSYFLLKLSVTDETLADITGSSNVLWFVKNQNIWGDFGLWLARIMPLPSVWSFLENLLRFLALFSPVTFILCLFHYAGNLIRKYEIKEFSGQVRLCAMSISLYFLYALPWLLLCKIIAFDLSSTDNLNELIARDGFFGLGGGGYLYLLMILLSVNSVWVSLTRHHWIFRAITIFIAGLIGWFLLNIGLEANIQKYGETFTGVDFLLGPDRENKLEETALFLRWIILYTGGVSILAWSMKFAHRSQKIRIENG